LQRSDFLSFLYKETVTNLYKQNSISTINLPHPSLTMRIEIHPEDKNQISAIYEINKNAFGREAEAKLVDLLRYSKTFIPELSLIAMVNGKAVGHILFTEIKIKNSNGYEYESLALAPMAVLSEYQRQGVGTRMIRAGLSIAKQLGHKSIIVLGHAKYYPQFGFLPAKNWNIKAPFDISNESFMALELVKDGLKNISGTVEYPKEFNTV